MEIRGDAATVAGVKAGQYIASIRNRPKKGYARRYFLYILRGRKGSCPPSVGLSTKVSRAVRQRLDDIFRQTSL